MASILMHLRLLCDGAVTVSDDGKVLRGKLPGRRRIVVREEEGGGYRVVLTSPFGLRSERSFASRVACQRGIYALDQLTDSGLPVSAPSAPKRQPSRLRVMQSTDHRPPHQEIVDLYIGGMSIAAIAALKRVSMARIRNILMWRQMVERDGVVSQRTYDILARIASGDSNLNIAGDYRISRQRLSQIGAYYGIPSIGAEARRRKAALAQAARRAMVVATSVEDVAQRMGCDLETARRSIRQVDRRWVQRRLWETGRLRRDKRRAAVERLRLVLAARGVGGQEIGRVLRRRTAQVQVALAQQSLSLDVVRRLAAHYKIPLAWVEQGWNRPADVPFATWAEARARSAGVAARFRRCLVHGGLRLGVLAKRCGCGLHVVLGLRCGRPSSWPIVGRVAKALAVPDAWLRDGAGPVPAWLAAAEGSAGGAGRASLQGSGGGA